MSDSAYDRLSPEEASHIDRICDRFERHWRAARIESDGPQPEAYLDGCADPARGVLLAELAALDRVYRERLRAGATRSGRPDTPNGATPTAPDRPEGWPRLPGLELLEVIGAGGMGVVFRARQSALDRTVAVKVMRDAPLAEPTERARFLQEARAVAALQHPNLVQIHEFGEYSSGLTPQPYLVLEFVRGGSLADQLRGAPRSPADAARLVETLASAIQCAHDQGIVHRDLKPANVLLAADGTPKVTDFGLATFLQGHRLTGTGDVLGTPSYMAPEQATGGLTASAPAVDVYGLGAILYELLTGRPPFLAETPLATLVQGQYAEPVAPHRLQPTVPRDLETICLKCLRKEPGRRYRTARELADDLGHWQRGEPIAARPVRWPERLAKWTWREPVAAGLVAGIAAVLVVGIVGVLWQWQRAESKRADADTARGEAEKLGRLEADAREEAEAQLYASRVTQAKLDIGASRLTSAERLLDECKARTPDRCRWEWDYLKRKCRPHLVEMIGHAQPIVSVVYTPDGRKLVSAAGVWNGTDPGEVKVWDANTGALLHTLPGLTSPVYRLAMNPAGTQVAAACYGSVHRWNLDAPDRPLPPFPCNGLTFSLAYHPDGKTLAVAAAGGNVQIWDVATGALRVRHAWHPHEVYDLAYSPDGRYFASACRDAAVTVRAADDYRVLHELRLTTDARRVAFCNDGRLLATMSHDGEVTTWDLATSGRKVATRHAGSADVRALAFRPDGRFLVAAARFAGLKVWFTRGWEDEPRGAYGTRAVLAFGYSPDASRLAVAQDDHIIRVWDETAPDEREVPWFGNWIAAVAISPDGRTIALAGGQSLSHNSGQKRVRLVSDTDGSATTLEGHTDWLTAVAYSPDGHRLASADAAGGVILWNPERREQLARLTGHVGAVHGLAFHPTDGRMATAGADHTLRFWDGTTESGRIEHPAAVRAVAFSSDGRLIATGAADGAVRVWSADTLTLRHTLSGHRAAVSAVAFRPGTIELVSADEESEVRFWDASDGRDRTVHTAAPVIRTRDGNPAKGTATECSLSFSPDGRRLAFGSPARPVQVWDPVARRPLLDLTDPDARHKQTVAFHPDGRRLLTASLHVLRFWDPTLEDPAARRATATARVPDWHARRANDDQDMGAWSRAEFHLSRQLEANPFRADLFARRGETRATLKRAAEADSDHAWALALTTFSADGRPALVPGTAGIWVIRGEGLAALGRWEDVLVANRFALWHQPGRIDALSNLASAHLNLGDEANFRAVCQEMVRVGANGSPAQANMVFHTVAPLRSGLSAEDWDRLGARAAQYDGWLGGRPVRGAALYRMGRSADALREFAPHSYPRAWDMLFRAMAHQQVGQPAEAARWLERAKVWAEEADRQANDLTAWSERDRWTGWNERAEVRALRAEAEELIRRSRLP